MFWISNQAEYFEEYVVKRKVSKALSFLCIHSDTSPLLLGVHVVTDVSSLYSHGTLCGIQREIFPPNEALHVSVIHRAHVLIMLVVLTAHS